MESALAMSLSATNGPDTAYGQLLSAVIEAIAGFGGSAHQDVIADFVSAREASQGGDRQATRERVRSLLERHRRDEGAIRPMFGPDSKRWMLKA